MYVTIVLMSASDTAAFGGIGICPQLPTPPFFTLSISIARRLRVALVLRRDFGVRRADELLVDRVARRAAACFFSSLLRALRVHGARSDERCADDRQQRQASSKTPKGWDVGRNATASDRANANRDRASRSTARALTPPLPRPRAARLTSQVGDRRQAGRAAADPRQPHPLSGGAALAQLGAATRAGDIVDAHRRAERCARACAAMRDRRGIAGEQHGRGRRRQIASSAASSVEKPRGASPAAARTAAARARRPRRSAAPREMAERDQRSRRDAVARRGRVVVPGLRPVDQPLVVVTGEVEAARASRSSNWSSSTSAISRAQA